MLPILSVESHGMPIACWLDGSGEQIFSAPTEMTLVKIKTRPLLDREFIEKMTEWCKGNCRSRYAVPIFHAMGLLPQQQFYFSDPREAMLFKLRWGNK